MVSSFNYARFKYLFFGVAFLLRLGLVSYGLWQDANFAVKYTDIDYEVLTDGARFVSEGGSPYDRSTYRYTPLIAYMLLPNVWWSKIIGKLLFLACDIIIGALVMALLKYLLKERKSVKAEEVESHAMFYTLFWLFNPIAMNVSTRGNAESVIGALVLLALYLVVVHRSIFLSAFVFGLAIHVKIYPIVFSLALFLFVDSWTPTTSATLKSNFLIRTFKTFFNWKRIAFALVTVATIAGLTAIFYVKYGWTFLYETYLYHLVRKDNRHNFSVYFYHIYLTGSQPSSGSALELVSKILLDFGPQLSLLLSITFAYYKDISFCILLQTMTFVAFNKVCTVQYFCWYFSLLPLALPWNKSMSTLMRMVLPISWAAGQGLWLWFAYRLEFLGENTFYEIWVAGIIYFVINVLIIIALVLNHQLDPVASSASSESKVAKSILVEERKNRKPKSD